MANKIFPHRPNRRKERAAARISKIESTSASSVQARLLGSEANQAPATRREISSAPSKRIRHVPPFSWVIVVGRVSTKDPLRRFAFDDVYAALADWAGWRQRGEKKFITGPFSPAEGFFTFCGNVPFVRKIFEGIALHGVTKFSVEESRPMLEEMTAHIALRLEQRYAELWFDGSIFLAEITGTPPVMR